MEDNPTDSTCGKNMPSITSYIVIKMQCHYYIQFVKRHIDSYKSGTWIPKCQLSAMIVSDKRNIPPVLYQVKLIGAKYPHDLITIQLLGA